MLSTYSMAFTFCVLLILHAAYSAMHYRELINALDEAGVDESKAPPLPLDVWIEVIVAFVLLLGGELARGGSTLRPIDKASRERPLQAPVYVTRNFDLYSTRARSGL